MKHSDTLTKLAPALAKAQAEFKSIHKDATNPFFSSKFASLDNIMSAVRPILATHGLSLLQGVEHPETVEGELACVNIVTRLLHDSGEWIQTDVVMPVGTAPIEKGKPERAATAQTAGSAITYGRRYGVSAILALSTDEDDDGNAAGSGRKKGERKPMEPPAEAPLVTANTPLDFGKKWRGKLVAQLTYQEVEWALEAPKATERPHIPEKWVAVFKADLARREDLPTAMASGGKESERALTDA